MSSSLLQNIQFWLSTYHDLDIVFLLINYFQQTYQRLSLVMPTRMFSTPYNGFITLESKQHTVI